MVCFFDFIFLERKGIQMKKTRLLLLFALLVFAAFAFAGCSQDSAGGTDDSTAGNTLRIGMECAYPPFNWTQADDSNGAVAIEGGGYAGGYDVEIAKLVAEAMGRELVIVKTAWDGLPQAVQAGTIDLIIAGMSPTAERKATIDFSDAYYRSQLVIVVAKDGPYADATSLQDFAGAKITAQLNTFHYTVIPQIKGVVQQAAMDDFSAMRVALESGIIDGYVSELPEAVSATTASNAYAYVEFPEGQGFTASDDDVAIAAGIKKNNTELLDAVNAALSNISEEQRSELMKSAIENQPISQ